MVHILTEKEFLENTEETLSNAKKGITTLIRSSDGVITTLLTHHESLNEILIREILQHGEYIHKG